VAEPLGIDLHIGLPLSEHARAADVATFHAVATEPVSPELKSREQPSGFRSTGLVNTSAWRCAEFPASNGHGNARSIALAMAPLANGGRGLLSPETIERAFEIQADGVDRMTGIHFKLGLGYGLHCRHTPVGINDRTLWWAGWGGSMCIVDVENRLTVSYVMNRMLGDGDTRAARVIFAAHKARAAA
jgi:CubicO group peptidase (beta-lactamase class C family)